MSDYTDRMRDQDFDREDEKHRAPVTHAQRVAFADAMMEPLPCLTAFWGATVNDPIVPCRFYREHPGPCEPSVAR